MSKAFPTKKELATTYKRWAVWLTIVILVVWLTTYIIGGVGIIAYGMICPIAYLAAIRCSWRTIQYENSITSYMLTVTSSMFFLISLLPWFLPIAR